MSLFVGLDWAKEKHAVCVVDQDGRVHTRLEAAPPRRVWSYCFEDSESWRPPSSSR